MVIFLECDAVDAMLPFSTLTFSRANETLVEYHQTSEHPFASQEAFGTRCLCLKHCK